MDTMDLSLTPQVSNKRILWIDELKGITMLLVVISHLIAFGLKIDTGKDFLSIFVNSFYMPLFFFLSGLVISSISNIKKLCSKLFQFMMPFLIIGILCTYYRNSDILSFFESGKKMGYWYLMVLSIFYILLYCIGGAKSIKHKYLIYVILPIFIYALIVIMNRFISQYVADLSCLSSCDYWLFFSFG